ncbi:MAG: hypothetical protein B7Y88_11415 [Sphingomonadales bacterium 32-64-17]|nr:MAG: hypothetical protein B7Y88_11415 [Sphingomonadales bacterium 32-64-17]
MAIDPLFSVAGKVALVTGGGSGIGAMIARGIVERGVRTYITGRNADRVDAAAAELRGQQGECFGLVADFETRGGVAALAADLSAREQRLDLLVNNAGTNAAGSLAEMEEADWDLVLGVNTKAPFFLIRELLPLLRAAASPEDPARVINVGSIGGLHVPNWEAHAYGASKAALHHLTRSLAKALGPDHITVNTVAPGPFPSGLTDVASEAVKRSVASHVPLGRPGQPEDAAGTVIFLASRAGAYVNGHVIPLDGGYIAAL